MVIALLRHRFQPSDEAITPITGLLEQLKEEATLKQVVNLAMDSQDFTAFQQQMMTFVPVPLPVDVPVASALETSACDATATS